MLSRLNLFAPQPNMFFWFGMTVDLTPFGFAVSGIVYTWGILRFNLLRFTPLALTQVFDTIRDGVILLDFKDQIVSYNKAAEGVLPELGLTKHYPAYAGEALPSSPELVERIRDAGNADGRFPFHRFQADRNQHYQCSVSFIYDSGTPIGKMLMFTGDLFGDKAYVWAIHETERYGKMYDSFVKRLATELISLRDTNSASKLLLKLNERNPLDESVIRHLIVIGEITGDKKGLTSMFTDYVRLLSRELGIRPSEELVQLRLVGARVN